MKKKYSIPLFALLAAFLFPVTVHAGEVNSAEQGILDAISATYEYDGAYYKVTEGYYAKVYDYLCRDDIDMSVEEVRDYLSQFYANIAIGISSGYMEKVGEVEKPQKPAGSSGNGSRQEEQSGEGDSGGGESAQITEKEQEPDENGGAQPQTEAGGAEEIKDNTLGSTQSGKVEYTVAPMNAVMYVWDTDTLNVRAEAYKDSELIGTLSRGDEVKVTGAATTGWAQIDYNGKTGYVSAVYLRTDGYMEKMEETESETLTETESETESESQTQTQIQTAEAEESQSVETESISEPEEKDYSDAKAPAQKVNVGMIAVVVIIILAVVSGTIVLVHKNRKRR